MRTENDIRAAMRTLAADAPDPGSVLSTLAVVTLRGTGSDRAARRGRLARLVAPVAAAAAVIAIAATAVAMGTSGRAPGRVPATADPYRGLPPYYVAILLPTWRPPHVTTVRDTRTGVTLATVRPPQGTFFVEAAGDADRDTFVLAAKSGLLIRFYRLQFNPASHSTRLTRLPVTANRQDFQGFTVSPDGTEVAVQTSYSVRGTTWSALLIYTPSGQLIRRWADPGSFTRGQSPAWAGSGYLAVGWWGPGYSYVNQGIRLIAASAPSGSLVGSSRLVVPEKTVQAVTFVLSGDGTTISAAVNQASGYPRVEQFSAATGRRVSRYGRSRQIGGVYWSNRAGSTLIAMEPTSLTPRALPWRFGVLTRGRFTPLPTQKADALVDYAF